MHHRGLSRAAAAHDRQHLAGLHLQVDALQHLACIFPIAVGEAHVFKADRVVKAASLRACGFSRTSSLASMNLKTDSEAPSAC